MKNRTARPAAVAVAVAMATALLWLRPFGASMVLVFAALALVAVAIARDAFVRDRTDDR